MGVGAPTHGWGMSFIWISPIHKGHLKAGREGRGTQKGREEGRPETVCLEGRGDEEKSGGMNIRRPHGGEGGRSRLLGECDRDQS